MTEVKKKYVLDANCLIKCKEILFTEHEYYITEGVIKEIKDESTRRKLNSILPLLKVEHPEEKDLAFVKYFSKQTGDFSTLSEVDLELIALTYMLHRKFGDVSELRSEPLETIYKYEDIDFDYSRQNKHSDKKQRRLKKKNVEILEEEEEEPMDDVSDKSKSEMRNRTEIETTETVSEEEEEEVNEQELELKEVDEKELEEDNIKREDEIENTKEEEMEEGEEEKEESCRRITDDIKNRLEHTTNNVEEMKIGRRKRITGCKTIEEEIVLLSSTDEEKEEDDGNGTWININNIDTYNINLDKNERFVVQVACITTDYAMQNVLYQLGLHVITVDGYKIKSINLWGFFCTSCYFFMKSNKLFFCSKCGNNSLRRVKVDVDNELKKLIVHIPEFKINTKNSIFSIPKKRNNKKDQKNQNKLCIFREDEFLIGGRKEYYEHQKKLYENQKIIKDPFNDNNIYDSKDWTYRATLKSGKKTVVSNPKIIIGGKKNIYRRKKV